MRNVYEFTSRAYVPSRVLRVIGIADPLFRLTQFVIAVERYSDGTPAPNTAQHKH
jgi:hypothetical protein